MNMNCDEIKQLLPDLLDGNLEPGLTNSMKRHLTGCPGCRREHKILRSMCLGIANLPVFEPSSRFNQKVLLSLGLQPTSTAVPAWAKPAIGLGLGLMGAWVALLTLSAIHGTSVFNLWSLTRSLVHGDRTAAAIGLQAVKAGNFLLNILEPLVRSLGYIATKSDAPVQLLGAMVLAGVIAAFMSKTHKPAGLRA
jgi:anti-sigma factor RsiW